MRPIGSSPATSAPSRRSTRSTTTRRCTTATSPTGLRLQPGDPLPKPMFGLAIEGTSKGAETKMGEALTEDDRRGSDAHGTSASGDGRDRPSRARRAAPADEAASAQGPLRHRGRHQAAEGRLQGDHHSRRPRGTIVTRSRPAAPVSSARCTCGSSRSTVRRRRRMPDGLMFVDATFGGSIPEAVPARDREGRSAA